MNQQNVIENIEVPKDEELTEMEPEDNEAKYDKPTNLVDIQGRLAYLTSEPIALFCPHCNASISTRVKTSATLRTHTFAAMMLVFCCIPFMVLPYCIGSCQKATHYCPACDEYIATYAGA